MTGCPILTYTQQTLVIPTIPTFSLYDILNKTCVTNCSNFQRILCPYCRMSCLELCATNLSNNNGSYVLTVRCPTLDLCKTNRSNSNGYYVPIVGCPV